MMRDVLLLVSLSLRDLFGFNRFCHSRDARTRRRFLLLAAVWALLGAMFIGYIGALCWGLVTLGLHQAALPYLALLTSLLVFAFGLFRTGQALFSPRGLDLFFSLPLRPGAVALSRLLCLYLEDMLLALAVFLPGAAVVGFLAHPPLAFYGAALLGALLSPLLPLAASTLLGAGIAALSARMKHKTLVQTALSLLLLAAGLAASFALGQQAETLSADMLLALAKAIEGAIARLYPPAIWLGRAAQGEGRALLAFFAASLLPAAAVSAPVVRHFPETCRRLAASSARHNYTLGALAHRSLPFSLWRRELRRYFSSTVYVTNTIIGSFMALAMAIALAVSGLEPITAALPVPLDIAGLVPFVLAAVATLMPPSSVALSMEGRTIWIAQSLPIPTRALMTAKLCFSLTLMLPPLLLAALVLCIALRPGALSCLWLLLIPALMAVLAASLALLVDVKLHRFDWEQETAVVKQGASAMLGGFAGPLAALLSGAACALAPAGLGHAARLAICLACALGAWGAYRACCRVDMARL